MRRERLTLSLIVPEKEKSELVFPLKERKKLLHGVL
jgi:hypothetical protein